VLHASAQSSSCGGLLVMCRVHCRWPSWEMAENALQKAQGAKPTAFMSARCTQRLAPSRETARKVDLVCLGSRHQLGLARPTAL
jgi:hypothetical protein